MSLPRSQSMLPPSFSTFRTAASFAVSSLPAAGGSLSKQTAHRGARALVSLTSAGSYTASSGSAISLSLARWKCFGPSSAGTAKSQRVTGSYPLNPRSKSRAAPARRVDCGTISWTRSSAPSARCRKQRPVSPYRAGWFGAVTEACLLQLPDVDKLSSRMLGMDEHRFRSVCYVQDPSTKAWSGFEPCMTTICAPDTGQILGVVDGQDGKEVGTGVRPGSGVAPGGAGRRDRSVGGVPQGVGECGFRGPLSRLIISTWSGWSTGP